MNSKGKNMIFLGGAVRAGKVMPGRFPEKGPGVALDGSAQEDEDGFEGSRSVPGDWPGLDPTSLLRTRSM